ncbi:MAG: class IV adenylate cyclase [Anaerolineae bacterium]|nr:class IV adenylate cyclase [Anaerolineae bacterium]
MTNYTETEIKLYCPNFAPVVMMLESIGAILTKPRVYERNVRYENAEKSLSARDIVVRLRQDDRVRLTYKEPLSDNKVDGVAHRFEAEVTVSDFDAMHLILGRLGYHPHLIYEKYRTTYTYDDLEIVLDDMPYGNFIEIEGDSAKIQALRVRLGLADAPAFADSYVDLFGYVCRALNLDLTDLTFENFRGVDVPPSAFYPPAEGVDDEQR